MSTVVKIIIGVLIALAVIAVCVIGGIFVYRLVSGPEETTATPVPTTDAAATLPPTVEAGIDDSWERVQDAGKIVVGTAADYPPFEYFVENLQIDGFDIAMMDEMGRRLGLQIEYHNFAFDGLGGALQLKQIDVAIAAISVTPERESLVDFTNVYLVGEDAFLASGDSDIGSIGSEADLAGYKVGVQRASVFENWLEPVLGADLFAYEKAEDAVRDLVEGRVDLVALDVSPAEAAVEAGGVKIVAQGLNQQRYAIALPKGAQSLTSQLNSVLTDLHNEGVIADLARHYLHIEQLPPTPTPAPTSTPAPPPACIDGLALVQHLNLDPSTSPQLDPGQKFTKSWRVKNTGTCTWNTGYRLVFAHGDRMGGNPVNVTREVPPGDAYDINLDLVAPLNAGTYQGFWQMQNANGQNFGERLSVRVIVVGAPTATPAPTQTPAPGITYTVDRDHIKYGECVNFYWKVDNVQAVYFFPEGADWRKHGVTGEETRKECPPVATTYYLRVVGMDGQVVQPGITIYVESAPDAPYIKRFTVDPPNQITLGQCVEIRWNVEGEVTKVTITSNNAVLWDNAPRKGNYQDCPQSTGVVGYGIEAVGPGGTSRQQQNVNVVDPATATPAPTAAPEQPVIYTFSVNPKQIADGACLDLNWSAGGGTSYIRILRNSDVVLDNVPLTGHSPDCPSPAGTYTYRLEAFNSAGDQVSQQQQAQVTDSAPQNPLANTQWRATAVEGNPVLEGTTLTAGFSADFRVSGSSGCNTFSGTYNVDGSSLTIGPLSATGALCEPEVMEQESAYLAALGSASGFTLEAGQLYILNGSGTAVIEYLAGGPR